MRTDQRPALRVFLTPKLQEMVRTKVASGLYDDASEVIKDALRQMAERDEIRQLKLDRLRRALSKGEADVTGGRVVELGDESDIEAFFEKL